MAQSDHTQIVVSTPLDSKYDAVSVDEVINIQTHLTPTEKEDLRNVLNEVSNLFSGNLGTYTKREFHLEVNPNATPIFKRHYPIPLRAQPALKKELDRLCDIGCLTRVGSCDWAFPTFIDFKKDGRIRILTDLGN